MQPVELKKLELKIKEEISKVEKDIQTLKKQMKPIAPSESIGRLSRMEAIQNKNIQEANLRAAQQRVSKLKVALNKVNHEDFGLCRECEEPISIGRLLVMPENNLCIDCARKHS